MSSGLCKNCALFARRKNEFRLLKDNQRQIVDSLNVFFFYMIHHCCQRYHFSTSNLIQCVLLKKFHYRILEHTQKSISCKNFVFNRNLKLLSQNLTGGKDGGLYITDVTNASRTMLMNIETVSWDMTLCRYFNIPMLSLPKIRSSSEIYGNIKVGQLKGIPISGVSLITVIFHCIFVPTD